MASSQNQRMTTSPVGKNYRQVVVELLEIAAETGWRGRRYLSGLNGRGVAEVWYDGVVVLGIVQTRGSFEDYQC